MIGGDHDMEWPGTEKDGRMKPNQVDNRVAGRLEMIYACEYGQIIKAVEFHEDGSVRRVEFKEHPTNDDLIEQVRSRLEAPAK